MNFDEIQKIGKKVREVCEEYIRGEYGDYHSSIDQSDLTGMCAIESFFFKKVLNEEGFPYVECRLVSILNGAASHCYNVVYDDIAVDLTATQFGMKKKVVIRDVDSHDKKINGTDGRIVNRILYWGSQSPSTTVINRLMKMYRNKK